MKGQQEVKVVRLPRISDAEIVLGLNEVAHSRLKAVPISESEGHIAGEFVVVYPPGAPIIIPGQRIRQEQIDYLLSIVEMGGDVVMLDPNKKMIYVVINDE